MMTPAKIAVILRTTRERLGLTQAQLAARAGCSRITLIAIEKGQGAQQRTLEALSQALGMHLTATGTAHTHAPTVSLAPSREGIPIPHFTGRLTLKDMMRVARIERATGRRVYG